MVNIDLVLSSTLVMPISLHLTTIIMYYPVQKLHARSLVDKIETPNEAFMNELITTCDVV